MSRVPGVPASPAIHVRGLRKRYGKQPVLDGLDLKVPDGTSFGLLGLNGAGKTTLIKCLLDLCAPDAGRVELFGLPSRTPAARTRLSYVPERFIPPHYLTCREFLLLVLSLGRAPFDTARVDALLCELELDPGVLPRPVGVLSKGMTQKLGLAACLLLPRALYVLDEPMSGLDPASRVAVKSTLQRLRAEGRTLFFTSHVLADVEALCASIAVLDRGAIRFHGPPAELVARYGETELERAFLKCIRDEVSSPADPR